MYLNGLTKSKSRSRSTSSQKNVICSKDKVVEDYQRKSKGSRKSRHYLTRHRYRVLYSKEETVVQVKIQLRL